MIENPSPDPTVPTPGILLEGKQRRQKPMSRAGRFALSAAIALVGVAGLVYEGMHGWPNGVRVLFVVTIPIAVLWGSLIVVAGFLLDPVTRAPWYQMWSLVEYFDEPHGVRLVAGRLAADQAGLVVRRGDNIEVHAALISSRRAGTERYYTFQVVAPSGSLEFTTPVWIEHLTMAPLEARAATWGITITTHGDATAIQRAGVGV